ncbi:PREDICTED: probable inactive histone-lysine N-methyltransferase SUVR2 [Nelumbo nucifera]|uniref:Inactive histone-lysine N-methyltransferase SUVR2 n=2 Tax=Nelumbo nucifera TaxID=4432 RepID=A0A822XLV3_NELNU|nr:PREDICTED: probable inactive histone-lysine N-methyltransferase SUVR2 [Nelumbo nucifera]DAD20039.1 TPA_asm: hypothetical protein HUJ06_021502 [Nelumbo nucifera]
MAPTPRAAKAFNAMKVLGIPEETVRPILKNLLKLYDKKWELIEEENYRALADAIFEYEETKAAEGKNKRAENVHGMDDMAKESLVHNESEPPFKRLRSKHQDNQASSSFVSSCLTMGESSSRKLTLGTGSPQCSSRQERTVLSHVHLEDERSEPESVSPETHLRDKRKEYPSTQHCPKQGEAERCQPSFRDRTESDVNSQMHHRNKGKEPVSPQISPRKKRSLTESPTRSICLKEPKVEPGIILLPKEKPMPVLMKPKSEPFTDDLPEFEVPIAICPPDKGFLTNEAIPDPVRNGHSLVRDHSTAETERLDPMMSNVDAMDQDVVSDLACKTGTNSELTNVDEESLANFEIASSPLGEVKISLNCSSAVGHKDFQMPNLDTVLKMVEDKCLKTYRITDPGFSVMNLMKELCQCFLELGTNSADDEQQRLTKITSKDNMKNSLGSNGNPSSNFCLPASFSNGSLDLHSSIAFHVPRISELLGLNGLGGLNHVVKCNQKFVGNSNGERSMKKNEPKDLEYSNSRSLVVVQQHHISLDDIRPLHDVNDISKGEERVKISVVNEISNEKYPPTFFYIPQNIVYQNGYVSFSLARVADEDCCSSCLGDCLSSSIPCACAQETGGEFAYTLEGLVKKEFLDKAISMNRDPQQHRLFYCKDCPLERSKNEDLPDPCKGHLVRKFIKECWSKCGCNKQCGNRVVQRGITRNLQVFLTSEEKGWGLRTLEDLPRGAFVCEYVGEILTNLELHERNMRSSGNEKHTYPVLLDADWGSEGVLKDEEALCLDATYYGNVARFVNHRCFDANLVEIPVEVETPDHHYYHLAFFTTREVNAMEELTWDYGIDFDDYDHPVKAFHCCCGSKFCRDIKPPKRTRSSLLVLR